MDRINLDYVILFSFEHLLCEVNAIVHDPRDQLHDLAQITDDDYYKGGGPERFVGEAGQDATAGLVVTLGLFAKVGDGA